LDSTDTIKVGDLGVAKRAQRGAARPGQLAGTPAYLAPELLQNKPYTGTNRFFCPVSVSGT
jgi:serine/threonine protein kinase